ncbi:MAG: C39 family peptidase [Cyanobium sp. 49614_E6]|jgi:hypothetical protein|nr:C39 family peptidase [Cyanobium sp. 49614_E6]
MTIQDLVFTPDRWRQVFEAYKGEPQQLAGIEELRQAIAQSDPTLLTETASWLANFHKAQPEPAKATNPLPVPYLHQQDMTSDGWRKCFTTTAAMIAEYLGAEPRGVAGERAYDAVRANYGDTTTAEAQLAALRHLGLDAHYRTDGDKQRLMDLIDKGCPVGVGWLHHGSVNSPTGGHWTCAVGYDNDHVIMHDPFGDADLINGTWDQQGTGGEFVKYSWKNWLPRWQPGGSGGWYLWCAP